MFIYTGQVSVVERAEARVGLLKEATSIAVSLRAIEAKHSELLTRRTEACKALRAAGAPIKDIQEALGVSRSRVNQLLGKLPQG